VGNPGCYPTCVVLGLAPLARAGLLKPDAVIADCKSGVSGAGRQALLGLSYCEVNDGFRAYKVLEHRHTPEMEQELSLLAGTPVKVTFTPHLVPMSRGILGTLYASLTESRSEEELRELYRQFYQGHPFVRLLPAGSLPDTRNMRGSNFCDLALRVAEDGRLVIVLSAIDNLNKGAAGQSVQNFNLMCGFPETMGLETPPFVP
jgi:N-acetyl-gamma-glutamyl-phosphate reductase